MKIRRGIIVFLFSAPTLLLLLAIILHKPTTDGVMITAGQLRQTQAAWTNHGFIPIETNTQFVAKLQKLSLVNNGTQINEAEFASLNQAILNLVLANYLGNYDAYRRFRLPIANYDLPSDFAKKGWDNWFHALFPDTPVPSSFDEIDRQIWNHIYGGHHYWLAIALDASSISLSISNQIPTMSSMDASDPNHFHCLESVSPGTYSFQKEMEKNLTEHHTFLVAKINFLVDTTDPPKSPRPFLYVLVFDPNANVWLPIEVAQCSTTGSKYSPPF
ncbi:MAG: hypothetical protein ACREC8_12245 [Limisphaerales bacterium]